MAAARLRAVPVASRIALTLLLAATTLGVAAGPAAAGVCSVTNLTTGVVGADLQQAIDAASSGDTLRISGTCVGPFTVARDLRMFGTHHAALDGNAAGSTLTIAAGRVKVVGLRITNGTGTDPCAPDDCSVGGGIYNLGTLTLAYAIVDGNAVSNGGAGIFNAAGASATIDASKVVRNEAGIAGGGIDNFGELSLRRSTVGVNAAQGGGGIINNGTIRMAWSTISDNVADPAFGGGIINNGTISIRSSRLKGNTAPAAGGYGGAIVNQIGSIELIDSSVVGNTANQLGGGIMGQAAGTITLVRSSVSANAAPFGGGIFAGGGALTVTASRIERNSGSNGGGVYASATATVTITRSSVGGNVASNSGGGVFEAGGSLTIGGSSLRGNSASSGGGIYATPGSILTIARSRITDNTVSPGIGGGIFNGGTIALTRSALNRNTAGSAGGGMFSSGGTATVEDSTIAGNTASSGGGLLNAGGTMRVVRSTLAGNAVSFNGGGIFNTDGALTVVSSTLNGNSASDPNGGGGGIFNDADGAAATTLELTNSTMTANVAPFGGAIINVGTVVVSRSTLTGNTATSGGGIFNGNAGPIVGSATLAATIDAGNGGGNCSGIGTTSSNGFNVVGADCAFASIGDQTVADTPGAIGIDPLADNGGPTRTMALLPTSPAVDAIPFGILSQDGTIELCSIIGSTDQRGVARPQGPMCDVGAFELVPSGDVAIVDSLGAATPATTFESAASFGTSILPFQLVGPTFALSETTVITEIGAFVNHNCIPNCPAALPFVAQVRAMTGGAPDPSTVLATFVLSDDGDSLVLSFESVSTNLVLPPGTYAVLFAPQDGIDGSLVGGASNPLSYQAGLIDLGFLDPTTGTGGLAPGSFAAVRILGHPA